MALREYGPAGDTGKRLKWPAPLNDSDQHHDDSDYQKDVNESPNHIAAD